jgi:hypothetical protein
MVFGVLSSLIASADDRLRDDWNKQEISKRCSSSNPTILLLDFEQCQKQCSDSQFSKITCAEFLSHLHKCQDFWGKNPPSSK